MLTFFFLTVFSISSSDTITIQTRDSKSAFSAFEKDLVEDIFRLYERKHGKKVNLKWEYKDFKSLFYFNDINTISINAITITEERKKKYIFSHPYFPIKQAIITSEKKGYFDWKKTGTRICIENSSIHYNTSKKIIKKYSLTPVKLSEFGTYSNQIKENKFDICISDVTTCWDESNDLIVLDSDNELLETSNYGILYPKNSPIRNDIDNILKYYLTSSSYYNIIRKHFGSLAVKYIRSFKDK